MLDVAKLNWLAGLVEGEGCFSKGIDGTFILSLSSTDRDVVEKAKAIFKSGSINLHVPKNKDWKTRYTFSVSGQRAIEWAFTLYSLLCQRRRAKIRELVLEWCNNGILKRSRSNTKTCTQGHSLDLATGYGVIRGGYIRCSVCINEYKKREYLRKRGNIANNTSMVGQDPVH